MKRTWLLGGLLALGLGAGCSAPQTKEEVWGVLEASLEGPHLWQSAVGWRPVYNDMIELGFSAKEAARHIRMSARYGPYLRGVTDLIRDKETAEDLALALEQAYEQGRETRANQDSGKGARPNLGYKHRRIHVSEREQHMRDLAQDLDDMHLVPYLWLEVYERLEELGLSRREIGAYIRRAARYGPNLSEFGRMLDETTPETVPRLKTQLSLYYSQSVDRLIRDEPNWLSYWHFPKGAESWIEEQKKREEQAQNRPPPQLPPELQDMKDKRDGEEEGEDEPAEPEPDYPEADFPEFGDDEGETDLEENPDLDAEWDMPPEDDPMVDDTGDEPPPLEEDDFEEPPLEEDLEDSPPVEDEGLEEDSPPVEDEGLEEDDGELPGLGDGE